MRSQSKTLYIMSTFLFDSTIFGPVRSRRLGVSLGINLLPNDRKLCSFDCLYCECGFGRRTHGKASLPSRQDVGQQLEAKLQEMLRRGELPDVLTFAGNGEPTLHHDFAGIIDDTLLLRDRYAPRAKVCVLSNASQLHRADVVAALRKVDDNILKVDAGEEETILGLNRPQYKYSLERTVEQIAGFGDNLIVQTMFVGWHADDVVFDNSTDECVTRWLEIIERIAPPAVMIYTIARDTPLSGMQKTPPQRLDAIAERVRRIVGRVQVSY